MTTTHTPGMWEVIPPRKTGKHWRVAVRRTLHSPKSSHHGKPVQYFIALIHNGAPGDTLETEAANARLIAAAPDLLAALESLDLSFGRVQSDKVCAKIEAAIAKAKGTL